MGMKALSGHAPVEEFRAAVRRQSRPRRLAGSIRSLDDVRTDSRKGKNFMSRSTTKGDWSRVQDVKAYRETLDRMSVACPVCGRDAMKRQDGTAICPRCKHKFQWDRRRAHKDTRSRKGGDRGASR